MSQDHWRKEMVKQEKSKKLPFEVKHRVNKLINGADLLVYNIKKGTKYISTPVNNYWDKKVRY